ncbi:MAG: serine/threonine-protein kinase [Gemmatimonadetes bacterium]|nr:serine/threonine-protein kinase [Gemmatimonadota bacterium]
MTDPSPRLAAALADRYRIERELGQGGMATVYLAEDLKHDRKVALKVLKPELAAVLGAERFVVEIKTTASLQHPHILPLFDSGTADGFLFYVMPYVEGETLRGKLDRETQLGVDEAVRITSDVASALHYAHTHGVIHRDIKPENILLHDGRPMVADFGIALAVSAAAGGRMTETGLSLGTPHYMSPEQATAEKEITGRSDVYSLGSVLYEMLTGDPPHTGSSAQQIIMKIITEPADPVTRVRKSVPPNVAAAVSKALEKLPADRFESAKAFAEALANPAFTAMTRAGAVPSGTAGASTAPSRRTLIAVGSIALLALAAAAWGWLRPAPASPSLQFDLAPGPAIPRPGTDLVISPDGSMLAYAGRTSDGEQGIWIRRLDGDVEFRKVAGTENGGGPEFSPDNQWILFRRGSDRAVVRVSVAGGGARTILENSTAFFFHWGTDDRIVYWGNGGNFIVPALGGEPRHLQGLGGRRPFLLPDGSGVLGSTSRGVVIYDLRSDSVSLLMPGGTNPVYAASGHLLYVGAGDGLFAVPFDLKSHKVTGRPVRVLDRVASESNSRGYSVSRTGTLVQHDAAGSGPEAAGNRLVIHGIGGGADTLSLPRGRRWLPRFSPTGRFIAYTREAPGGSTTEIVTFDRESGTETPITFNEDAAWPAWSPDERRLAYSATSDSGDAIRIRASDNSGDAVEVLAGRPYAAPSRWPRPDLLLFTSATVRANTDLYTVAPTAGATPKAYSNAPSAESHLTISPAGQFAAFAAREDAQIEVWMRDFPTPRGKWQVSRGGGTHPHWTRDGRHIFYWKKGTGRDTLMRARVDRTPSVVVRAPESVAVVDGIDAANWDMHPDGTQFIVAYFVDAAEAARGTDVSRARHIVHLNFFTTLKAMVKPGARE